MSLLKHRPLTDNKAITHDIDPTQNSLALLTSDRRFTNAIFNASGARIRALPITAEVVKGAMKA